MTSLANRPVAPEMLALLLVEVGITFLLVNLLPGPAGPGEAIRAAALPQAAVAALTVGVTSLVLGAYRPHLLARTRALVGTVALGAMVAVPAAWGIGTLLGLRPASLLNHGAAWPAQVLAAWVAALLAVRFAFQAAMRARPPRRVAVLGVPGSMAGALAAIRADRERLFDASVPAGPHPSPGALRAAGMRMALVPAGRAAPAEQARFAAAGVELLDEPAFWERHLRRMDVDHLEPSWFAALDARPRRPLHDAAARVGDILTSVALLLLTLPLMLLVAALIRLDSPGPVLYRQERVGLGGRPFVLLKFRSMRCDAEARGPAWAQRCDPRVTRVGAVIRLSRIDELPQLLNVLRGEMAFIGPRPERPHFVAQLAAAIPFYCARSRVKPGLTGWAQVNFPYGASVEDARVKLSYDLYYVKYRSPMLDLAIMLATVRVILFQEGAR